jgi:hypothetical protein
VVRAKKSSVEKKWVEFRDASLPAYEFGIREIELAVADKKGLGLWKEDFICDLKLQGDCYNSVAWIRLVKSEKPNACVTLNCKVRRSEIALWLPGVPSCVNKLSINPIIQAKPRLISHAPTLHLTVFSLLKTPIRRSKYNRSIHSPVITLIYTVQTVLSSRSSSFTLVFIDISLYKLVVSISSLLTFSLNTEKISWAPLLKRMNNERHGELLAFKVFKSSLRLFNSLLIHRIYTDASNLPSARLWELRKLVSTPSIRWVFYNFSSPLKDSVVPVVWTVILFLPWSSVFNSFNFALRSLRKAKSSNYRESFNCGGK